MKKFLFCVCFVAMACLTEASTIYFYRLKNMFMLNSECAVVINDSIKFSLANGTYYKFDTDADAINIVTSYNNLGLKNLKIEKNKTYYFQVEFKTITSVNVIQRDANAGNEAIERLKVDQEVKNINADSLKHISVTTIAPIPKGTEDCAKIYLFRPFNVTGVSGNVNITDGENLYELKNNSSYVIMISSHSSVTLTTVRESIHTSNSTVKLNTQLGGVYYVAVIRSGGAFILTQTTEEYAKNEMKLP